MINGHLSIHSGIKTVNQRGSTRGVCVCSGSRLETRLSCSPVGSCSLVGSALVSWISASRPVDEHPAG